MTLYCRTNFSSVLIGYEIENFWRLENFSILYPINTFEKFVIQHVISP